MLRYTDSRLQRAFAVTSAGIEGGKNLAESAQDLERTRKAISVQLAEFDGVFPHDTDFNLDFISIQTTITDFFIRSKLS